MLGWSGRVVENAWTLGIVFLLAACGDDASATGCPIPSRSCDISRADCQSIIFRAAACERGQKDAAMPPVRVISLDQFTSEMAANAPPADAADSVWTSALQRLGLLPASTTIGNAVIDASVANVAAYYDPSTKDITVIDRAASGPATSSDPLEDIFELAHEFTHALQDQQHDIEAFRAQYGTSTDSHVAVTSLIEGEATVLGLAVMGRSAGQTPEQLRWASAVDSLWTSILGTIEQATPPLITAVQALPYPLGTQYLYPRWLAGGQPAIETVYDDPLLSVLDWRSDIEVGTPTLVEPLDCYPTTPPAGYTGFDSDSFGMTGTLAAFVGALQSGTTGWDDSLPWRGDSVVVFQSSAGPEVAVAWRVRWESAPQATDFATALQSVASAPSRVAVSGREVTVFVADATVIDAWAAAMACGVATDLPKAVSTAASPAAVWRRLVRPGRGGKFHPSRVH